MQKRALVKPSRAARGILSLGVLLGVLVAPPVADANVATVAVLNGYFQPEVFFLDGDTTVEFDWKQGTHRLIAYRQAAWDSGERQHPSRFQTPFDGGTVRYRCTIHSQMDSTGACTGMCGIITDDPNIDLTKPVVEVTSPRAGEIVVPVPEPDFDRRAVRFPVRIEGRAVDDRMVEAVGVRWWDNAGRSFDVVAECPGCKQAASVAWHVELSLLPGTYLVEASAADPSGNRAFSKPPRMFVVV